MRQEIFVSLEELLYVNKKYIVISSKFTNLRGSERSESEVV